jgi:hypothetical protein
LRRPECKLARMHCSAERARARLRSFLAALVFTCTPASAASAQEDGGTIQFNYRASDGCPDRASFVARVRARTTRAQLANPGTGPREGSAFDVEVDAGHPAYGRVIVGDPHRPDGTRRVQADTCDEVADALALVVALAIDPSPPLPPLALVDGGPPAPEAAVSPAVAPPVPSPSVELDPTPPGRGAIEELRPRSSPARHAPPAVLSAGLDAAVDVGVSPAMLVGLSVYAGWTSRSTTLFSPSLRLALDRAQSGTLSAPGGTAAFTWSVGRLDACPVARVSHGLRVTACARVEAGALEVSGGNIVAPMTKTRFWLATGALARGQWTFFEPLFLNIEAGADLRATSDRFYFFPDTTVYRVPWVGVSAAAGLGAYFL